MNKAAEEKSIFDILIGFLYPVMLLLSLYIILNGHVTPGGGFQGGAVLASIAICRYLAYPIEDIRIKTLQAMEKILFLGILVLPVALLLVRPGILVAPWDQAYLIGMNLLIGIKVGSGLTVIFFRFVFYEGVD